MAPPNATTPHKRKRPRFDDGDDGGGVDKRAKQQGGAVQQAKQNEVKGKKGKGKGANLKGQKKGAVVENSNAKKGGNKTGKASGGIKELGFGLEFDQVLIKEEKDKKSRKRKRAKEDEDHQPQATTTGAPEVSIPTPTAASPTSSFPLPNKFTIVVGSYERILYGFDASFSSTTSNSNSTTSSAGTTTNGNPDKEGDGSQPPTLNLTPIFSFAAHLSCIKCLAVVNRPTTTTSPASSSTSEHSSSHAGKRYLLSGSTDETVKVWDLDRRKEVGSLTLGMGASGASGNFAGGGATPTSLTPIPALSSLFITTSPSASDFGSTASKGKGPSNVELYRTRDWMLLRGWRGHGGAPINCSTVHPSGRVALTVGNDRMLRMWDLVAGREEGKMKLGGKKGLGVGKIPDLVRFSPSGTHFALIIHSTLTVYRTDLTPMTSLSSFPASSRFHDVRFCSLPLPSNTDDHGLKEKEVMLVACEDGRVRVFEVETNHEVGEVTKNGKENEEKDNENEEEEAGNPAKLVGVLSGHRNRVKMVDFISLAPTTSSSSSPTSQTMPTHSPSSLTPIPLATTISSDGFIHVYDLSPIAQSLSFHPPASNQGKEDDQDGTKNPVMELSPIARYDTKGMRLVCLCVSGSWEKEHDGGDEVDDKRLSKGGDEESEEAGDDSDDGGAEGLDGIMDTDDDSQIENDDGGE